MRVQNSQTEADRHSDSPHAMNSASTALRGALDRLAAALVEQGAGRARGSGAHDSAELEPVLYLQWRSALSDESGQTFLAAAKSGAIVIYEGTPQKPGSLIWSSAPEEQAAPNAAPQSVTPAPAPAQEHAQTHLHSAAAPSAETAGTQEVFITSRTSGKRLAVDVTHPGSRGRLILQAPNGGAHQRFLATVHEGKYLLRAAQASFIINAAQGTKGQGWQLIEVPSPDSEDQGLTIEETAEGDYRIRAPKSGRWLAAAHAQGGEVPVLDAIQGREPASRWLIHAAPPIPRLCALDLASVAPRPKTDGALDVVLTSGQVPCVDALAGTAFRIFSGDFLKRGRDQLLVVRPANKHHHVDLLQLGAGGASVLRSDLLEPGSWIDGWLGPNDLQLVGDLAGHGSSQLLLLHRGQRRPGEQAVLLSLQNGCAEPRKLYADNWGEANWLDGWLDPNDAHLVGDFMGLGHDQWLMMNRNPRGGKIRIVDIKGGSPRRCYTEVWGQSPLLNGWMDEGCVMLSGDFLNRGHQQVLFINRDISINTGKVLIVDFCRPSPPAEVCYRELWGQSDLLNDFLGESDVAISGDFMGAGYSQVLFVGRKGEGEKFLVADFHGGAPPLAACVREPWGQRGRHESLIHPGSVVLAGKFRQPGEGQAPSAQVVLL